MAGVDAPYMFTSGLRAMSTEAAGARAGGRLEGSLAAGSRAEASTAVAVRRAAVRPTPATAVPNGSLGSNTNGVTNPNLTMRYNGGLWGRMGFRVPTFKPTTSVVHNPVSSTFAAVERHELAHAYDMLNHPWFSYLATTSTLPGRGSAAFLMEMRGYYAEFGVRGLNPGYAWGSLWPMERRYLVGEIGAGTIGAGGTATGAYLWWHDEATKPDD
jgi:hypothetical protein